jgi:hypothetical protein
MCFPYSGSPTLAFGNTSTAKGSVYLQIAWEVFSVSERKVVFRKTTEGTFRSDDPIGGAERAMTLNAFTASLLNLAADPQFRELVLQQPKSPANDGKRPSLPA